MLKNKLFIILVALSLVSCGFHLRGQYEIPEALQFVEIQGVVSVQLNEALKRQLENNGINIVANELETPRAFIQLTDELFKKEINNLATTGQVKDYNLDYSVVFSIFASKDLEKLGKTISIDNQQVTIHRILDVDQQSILASDNEERIIRKEMYDELAQMIMFRIQALTKRKARNK